MTKRTVSSIAFVLVMSACLFGLAKCAVMAKTLQWNDRGHYREAQVNQPLAQAPDFTPVSGAAVADFDGDGNDDAFLSQNYFALWMEDCRMDAGEGLLLLGDGQGGFVTVFGHRSGIRVYGEQRGCAVGDLNADGRPDLLVTQNKGDPKLYLNALGQASRTKQ